MDSDQNSSHTPKWMIEYQKKVNCVGPLKWIIASFLIHTRSVSCHWPGDTKKSFLSLEPRNEYVFSCVYIHRIAMAYKCQISSYVYIMYMIYIYMYIYIYIYIWTFLYDRTHPWNLSVLPTQEEPKWCSFAPQSPRACFPQTLLAP